MKLIYANESGVDLGIIPDFSFDLAYGNDENNFELKLAITDHCCQQGYLVYMIDEQNGFETPTEYGGVVDTIAVDTSKKTVTYKGRTWHGMLAGKVIAPDDGQDYKIVSGNASVIIRAILADIDLSQFFEMDDVDSPITIFRYQFPRYVNAYTGIQQMLAAFGGKLKVRYENGQVILSAVWLTDYGLDEEWDASQVKFKAEQNLNRVNHLICLGRGDLRDRYRIDLFTDANGGIQPFALNEPPLEDTDYVLDDRYKKLAWTYEITQVLDYPSAEERQNYILLTTQPSDWADNFTDYYYLDENSEFKAIERDDSEEYTALTTQPSGWATKYSNYFTSDHKAVEGTTSQSYTAVTTIPPDWSTSWAQYYYYDSSDSTYKPVSYTTAGEYEEQTEEPEDWATNYSSYYQRKVATEFVTNSTGEVVRDGIFARVKKSGDGYEAVPALLGAAPPWKRGRYFTYTTPTGAPVFNNGVTKYKLTKTVSAPTFVANRYYSRTTTGKTPSFASNVYYRLAVDHYAALVEKGVERLQDVQKRMNSISINLDLYGDYDIGDIVGAKEETTGIEVWQPITKKIVKIDRKGKSVTYKVGEIKY